MPHALGKRRMTVSSEGQEQTIVLQGALRRATAIVDEPEVVMRFGAPRVQVQRQQQRVNGVVGATRRVLRQAAVHERLEILGVARERQLELAYSLVSSGNTQ